MVFSAWASYKKDIPSDRTFIFDQAMVNEGQGYNYHTGIFTCPVSGYYAFTWATQATVGHYLMSWINKNGNHYRAEYLDATKANSSVADSKIEVTYLNKGDIVSIMGHGFFDGLVISPFTGWKIN